MAAKADIVARDRGWRARLALRFGLRGDKTAVVGKSHSGPLCIQKPFYPGGGACHVYVLHPPGGLAGGDDLAVDLRVESGASALVTMPAATKFYRSPFATSSLANRLGVADGATLEWLPPETILFGGSAARMTTSIDLHRGARFLGWEMLTFGRPLSGDHYASGRFDQRLECRVDGRLVLLERMAAQSGDALFASAWGLAGEPNCATLFAYPADPALLEQLRKRLLLFGRILHGATVVDDWLVLRMVGRRLPELRQCLEAARQSLAPALLGQGARNPRIWNT